MANHTVGYHLKETIKLAIPIVLSQVGQNCFTIIDSAMVGRLGAVPLGASAFVANVTNIPMVFILGLSSAISVLTSQNFGAKNYKECGRILNNAMIYVAVFALVICGGLEILAPHLNLFGQPKDVIDISLGFFHAISWSIFPFVIFFALKHYSEALSHPVVPLVFLAVGIVLNIFLNYVFIYGHFGSPAFGLVGSGFATLIARCLVVVGLYAYILKSKKFEKYRVPFSRANINFDIMKHISRIGIPSGFQFFFEVGAFAGCGIMMGWFGATALAAHQIAIQVASFTFMVALGFSFATSVRIGKLKGELDYQGIRTVGYTSFWFIGGFQLLMGVGILLLREKIPEFFVHDDQVKLITGQLLVIAFLFQIFDGTQAVGVSALRGLQDVRIPTVITFVSYWVIALPLAYILAFTMKLGYIGIWVSLGISLSVASALLISRFVYKTRKLLKEYAHLMVEGDEPLRDET